MRLVGEASFSQMKQSNTRKLAHKVYRARNNKVVCKCGIEAWVQIGVLRLYRDRGYGFVCRTCKGEDADELLQARIAIARRKGLIK